MNYSVLFVTDYCVAHIEDVTKGVSLAHIMTLFSSPFKEILYCTYSFSDQFYC